MDVIARVNELLKSEKTFCLATVIASDSAEIPAGSKVIVFGDGTLEGGVKSQSLNVALRDQALSAIDNRKSSSTEIKTGVRVFLMCFALRPGCSSVVRVTSPYP